MVKKLIIFFIIALAFTGGVLFLVFVKPDILHQYTPDLLKGAPKGVEVGKMNVPVIFDGKVYKYIYMDIRVIPSNPEDNKRVSKNISRYRDMITRDIYFFIASRPPQVPIREEQVLSRLDLLFSKNSDTKEPVKVKMMEFVEKDSQGQNYLKRLDDSKEQTKKSLEVKQAENFLEKADIVRRQEEEARKKGEDTSKKGDVNKSDLAPKPKEAEQ